MRQGITEIKIGFDEQFFGGDLEAVVVFRVPNIGGITPIDLPHDLTDEISEAVGNLGEYMLTII